MILFWGRSNQRALDYGEKSMRSNYRIFRWEDLCREPARLAAELIEFAGGDVAKAVSASNLVAKPASMGRWAAFPAEIRDPVVARGEPWLDLFGYR
jgi:hypothetical protein